MKSISFVINQLEPNLVKRNPVINYGIRNAVKNVRLHPTYVENSVNSVVGGLLCDSRHLLFATNANSNPDITLKKELENQINFLRKSCNTEDVRGFLVGGLDYCDKDKEAQASYYFYSKLAETFDKLKVPFSMFCGRSREIAPENVYVRSNHVRIANKDYKKIMVNEESNSEKVMEIAEDYYRDVVHDSGYDLNIQNHF